MQKAILIVKQSFRQKHQTFLYMIKVKERSLLQFLLQQVDKSISSSQQDDASGNNSSQDNKNEATERRITVAKKKWQANYQRFSLQSPITSAKVYYLFGYMPINEQSFEDPLHEESLILNYFRGRMILQVEVTKTAVVLEMGDLPTPDQPALQHLIEKYKAKGNLKFYQLAETLRQVSRLYTQLANIKPAQQKPDSYRQTLRSLGDKMYSCAFGANKVAFSKSLLTHLGYDPEQFAVDALKMFATIAYPIGVKYVIDCLKVVGELTMGKITYEEFLQAPKLRFQTFILSKDNVKSYVDVCIGLITPSDFLNVIEKVHYQTDDVGGMFVRSADKIRAIEYQKKQYRKEQFPVLRKLQKQIPGFSTNQKQAGYIQIQREEKMDVQVKEEEPYP